MALATLNSQMRARKHPTPSVKSWSGFASFCFAFLATNITYGAPVVLGTMLDSFVTLVISLVILVSISFGLLLADPRHFCLYWLHLVILQNAVSGLWFSDSEGEIPLVVTEAKTLAMVVAVMFCLPRILKVLSADKWLVGGVTVYFAGLVLNFTGFGALALATLRNFTIPLAALFVAASLARELNVRERIAFLRVVLGCATFWLVLGAAGEMVFTTPQWRAAFNADSLGGLNSLSEVTSIFGYELSRIGGLLLEPVNAGYMAASVLVVLWVLRRSKRGVGDSISDRVCLLGSTFALVSAATKNGLMMFLLAGVVSILLHRGIRRDVVVIVSCFISFVTTLAYATLVKGPAYLQTVFLNPVGASGGESTSIHMAGLISGFQGLADSPFGHGLGTGGNFLKLFDPTVSRVTWLSTGGESAWGTLAYQGGLLCVAGLLLIVVRIARAYGAESAILLAVWAGAALFAESFFGPIASSILMIGTAFLSKTNDAAVAGGIERATSPTDRQSNSQSDVDSILDRMT
ncbi:hypothetical protein [Arthrobacter cavernae]|uniref:O-antigen ligase domain-containing protein n=1 Tax=Arthrobacter cavernae TaxID=2817681 RepID=A0A939HG71_9MICC|nr:hypothetical protein [Arthrobacter cavernae]MBO1267723.1 hypothetical protein [Arthrobacter cavernae]